MLRSRLCWLPHHQRWMQERGWDVLRVLQLLMVRLGRVEVHMLYKRSAPPLVAQLWLEAALSSTATPSPLVFRPHAEATLEQDVYIAELNDDSKYFSRMEKDEAVVSPPSTGVSGRG